MFSRLLQVHLLAHVLVSYSYSYRILCTRSRTVLVSVQSASCWDSHRSLRLSTASAAEAATAASGAAHLTLFGHANGSTTTLQSGLQSAPGPPAVSIVGSGRAGRLDDWSQRSAGPTRPINQKRAVNNRENSVCTRLARSCSIRSTPPAKHTGPRRAHPRPGTLSSLGLGNASHARAIGPTLALSTLASPPTCALRETSTVSTATLATSTSTRRTERPIVC